MSLRLFKLLSTSKLKTTKKSEAAHREEDSLRLMNACNFVDNIEHFVCVRQGLLCY